MLGGCRRARLLLLAVALCGACFSGLVFAFDQPAASAAGGCPPPESTASGARSPAAGSETIIACVAQQSISLSAYWHWARVVTRSQHHLRRAAKVRQVMGFLISSDWVIGEAEDLGIQVSEAEVTHTFNRIRREQFPNWRDFHAFLRSSGQTVRDLLFRVRLNMLSMRIQKQVTSAHRGVHEEQRALMQFVQGFRRRWTAQTYCKPQYAVADCGHIHEAL